MEIQEVLKFIDDAVLNKTGKHLNDLQRRIIESALNRQKYADIADDYDRTEGHVRDVAYELLQLLSNIFNEPVTKHNLKSVVERQEHFKFFSGNKSINSGQIIDSHIIGSINLGSDYPKSSDNSQANNYRENKYIFKINKLRKCGLSNEEIAELLEIDLELVKNVETGDFDY